MKANLRSFLRKVVVISQKNYLYDTQTLLVFSQETKNLTIRSGFLSGMEENSISFL